MQKLFLLAFPVLLISCSDQTGNTGGDSLRNDSTVKTVSAFSEWHTLTESWAASLNLKSASIMKSFYADSVSYYGDPISADDVVKRQTEYFSAHPDYKIRIFEYVSEEQQPDGSWQVRIVKQVRADGNTANYPSSLTFAQQNGVWKIIAESDDVTDLNKALETKVSYNAEIELEGLIEETSGFMPVKDGDPKSEGRKNYFILWPASLLDIPAAGAMPEEHNVDRVQIIGDAGVINPLLNKKVKVTGTLIHQSEAGHFTKVVMQLSRIETAK